MATCRPSSTSPHASQQRFPISLMRRSVNYCNGKIGVCCLRLCWFMDSQQPSDLQRCCTAADLQRCTLLRLSCTAADLHLPSHNLLLSPCYVRLCPTKGQKPLRLIKMLMFFFRVCKDPDLICRLTAVWKNRVYCIILFGLFNME